MARKRTARKSKSSRAGDGVSQNSKLARRTRVALNLFESDYSKNEQAALLALAKQAEEDVIFETQEQVDVWNAKRMGLWNTYYREHPGHRAGGLANFMDRKAQVDDDARWRDLSRITSALRALVFRDDSACRAKLRDAASAVLRKMNDEPEPITKVELVRRMIDSAGRTDIDRSVDASVEEEMVYYMTRHRKIIEEASGGICNDARIDDGPSLRLLEKKIAGEIEKTRRRIEPLGAATHVDEKNVVIAALVAWGLPRATAKNWVYPIKSSG
jgi:hypothetical protein